MTLVKRTARGFAWNYFGRSVEYVLVYIVSLLVARKLGSALNGIYAIFLSISQSLLVVASLGLENVSTSLIPRLLAQEGKRPVAAILQGLLLTRLAASVVVSIALLAGWSTIGGYFGSSLVITQYLGVLVLYFTVRGLVSLLTSFLVAHLDTRSTAFASAAGRLLDLVGVIFLLYGGASLEAVFVLLTSTSFVQLILLVVRSRSFLFVRTASTPLRRSLVLGVWFWCNSLMEFILGRQADILLLGYFLVGTAAIGQYDVALGFSQAINVGLTTGLAGVSIAALSSMTRDSRQQLSEYWMSLSHVVALTVVPFLVCAVFLANSIIPSLYSSEYLPSVGLFQISALFLAATRLLGGGLAADYLHATGNTRALLVASLLSGTVNLLLAIVLIPRHGTYGAAVATGVAAVVVAGVHASFLRKNLDVTLPFAVGLKAVFLSALSMLLAQGILPLSLEHDVYLLIAAFLLIFSAMSYLAKPLSTEDAQLLLGMNATLGLLASRFARMRMTGSLQRLSDRQKWAYAWLPESRITLDIGSSSGPLCGMLLGKSLITIALDNDPDSLALLKSESNAVLPIRASAHELPIRSGSVNSVLLLDVLEHVSDDHRAIEEAARVLCKDGTLVLSVPNKGMFAFLDPQNLRAMFRGKKDPAKFHRHYSYEELSKVLRRDFSIERKHYGGLFLYPLSFALNHSINKYFRLDLSPFFKRLGDWDNDISWGRVSYNLILKAKKL